MVDELEEGKRLKSRQPAVRRLDNSEDERGMSWGGAHEKIDVKERAREATGQLQPALPAAGSCSGQRKWDKDVQEGAAGDVTARGGQVQLVSGAAALLCGAWQLQGSATTAAAAVGGDKDRGTTEKSIACRRNAARSERWRWKWKEEQQRGKRQQQRPGMGARERR